MKLINITNNLIHEVVNSIIMNDDVKNLVLEVIRVLGPSYTEFIHYSLSKCSNNYIRADSPECPLSNRDREVIYGILARSPIRIETSDILVADRVDLLYATDYRCYQSFSKFNAMFYGSIEEHFYGNEELLDSNTYLEMIEELEKIVGIIEQIMMLSSTDELLEDTVVIMLSYPNPNLYALVY